MVEDLDFDWCGSCRCWNRGIVYDLMCDTDESTSSLYILSKTTTLTSLTDLQMGTQLTQDYMVLAKSRNVVESVIQELELDMTY